MSSPLTGTLVAAVAAIMTAACAPPVELTFMDFDHFVAPDPFGRVVHLEHRNGLVMTRHLAPNDAELFRNADLTPAGVEALDAALTDVANSWDASLACVDCVDNEIFTFELDGEIISTSHAGGPAPAPYVALEAFAEGIFATLSQCQPSAFYQLTAASCPSR